MSQLADRFPRRAVLVSGSLAQAVLIGLMAVPGMPMGWLFVLFVFARLANAPGNAAQNALGREIFGDDDVYLQSQDLRGITNNTAMLAGLAAGGLLVTGVGTSWALAIDALTFLVAAVTVRLAVLRRPAAGDGGTPWFGAVRQVFGDERLRVLLYLSWLVGLAVIPEGLAAPLAAQLGAGDQAVGWLLAADPLGFVVGTFLLSRFVSTEHRRRLLGVLAALPLAALAAFALRPNLAFALVLLALAGATGAYVITVSATFITWIPNDIRGSAGGLYRTGLRVAQGVGVGIGGLVAQWARFRERDHRARGRGGAAAGRPGRAVLAPGRRSGTGATVVMNGDIQRVSAVTVGHRSPPLRTGKIMNDIQLGTSDAIRGRVSRHG